MADEKNTKDVEETEGPKQTVVREPADLDIGPHFPSGMSAPEAALAGATEGMTDAEVASLKGEKTEATPTSEPEQRAKQ